MAGAAAPVLLSVGLDWSCFSSV